MCQIVPTGDVRNQTLFDSVFEFAQLRIFEILSFSSTFNMK